MAWRTTAYFIFAVDYEDRTGPLSEIFLLDVAL